MLGAYWCHVSSNSTVKSDFFKQHGAGEQLHFHRTGPRELLTQFILKKKKKEKQFQYKTNDESSVPLRSWACIKGCGSIWLR